MKDKLTLKSHLSKVQLVVYDRKNVDLISLFAGSHNCYYYSMMHQPEGDADKVHWHVAIRSAVGSKGLFRLSQIACSCSSEQCSITPNLFERLDGLDGFLIYCTHKLEEGKEFTYEFSDIETNDPLSVEQLESAWEKNAVNTNTKKVDYVGACVEAILAHQVSNVADIYYWFLANAFRKPSLQELSYCKAFIFVA